MSAASRTRLAPVAPPPQRPRARLLLQTVVVMLAVTACCMFAGLIAHRAPFYIDATSTRVHRLSAGTLATLARLAGPTELVVTINSAAIDARSAERTRDVLDTFDRASDRLSVTIVDVASPAGLDRLDEVWARIAARCAAELEEQRRSLGSAAATAEELAPRLERLGASLAEIEKVVDTDVAAHERTITALKRFINDAASFCRLGAKDITEAIARSKELSTTTIGRSPIPALDSAAQALRRPLPTISAQLGQLAQSIDAATGAKNEQVPLVIKDRLRPIGPELGEVRDRLARVEGRLSALPRPPVISVARVLERSSAAMVVGPPGAGPGAGDRGRNVAGVDIDSLFPAQLGEDVAATRIDLRARTEELIASALASLVNPAPPIVMLMHGENARLAPDFSRFAGVFERLRLRGIDVVEWATALDKNEPSVAKLARSTGEAGPARPIVYAALYTVPETPEDAARFVALSRVLENLIAEGKPLLLSISPSTLPAIGQDDPVAALLVPLGIKPDSGRPILHRVGTPASPVVTADTMLTGTAVATEDGAGTPDRHVIRSALSGLRTRLPWAIPLRVLDQAPATISPLLMVLDDGTTWAESQWSEFRAVPAPQRPYIRVQDQPREDSQRDDGAGPWVVAAAVERKAPERTTMQRLVIVGASGWFLDEIAEAAVLVDNKRVPVNPGNSELFEASVYWLAGQESVIGTSPQSAAAAVIPPLSPGTISAIRWALVGGLPVLILLIGAVWRTTRG